MEKQLLLKLLLKLPYPLRQNYPLTKRQLLLKLLVFEEPKQRTDELNSTYISDNTNVTKYLHMDISDDETERNLDAEVDGHRIIETYKLVLPTLKEVIDKEGLENGNRDERIAKKGCTPRLF